MAASVFQLSRTDSFDKSFFRISKWILGFLGCWPLDPLSRRTIIKIVFNFTILLIAITGEIRLAWFLRRDPLSALDVLCPCLTKVVTWMKLICFLVYRKDVRLILKSLFEHCQSDSKNFKKNSLIAKVSFLTNTWCIVLYINGLSTSCLFALKPLIIWGYQFFVNGQKDSLVALPFHAALPYEDMSQMNDKTLYSLIYCILAQSGMITTFGISGTDGAFLCFCMYISVSYQCLQEDFRRTFKLHTSKDLDSANNEVLYNNLTELVRRQQNINQIFKSFNRIYKFIIFVHFVSASVSLAFLLVILTLTPGFFKLNYIIYALGIANHLFACCYGAESVDKNCIQLSEVLYFCEWYKCNKKVKSLILFALTKSQRGSPMKAPFFSPSLQLFASIIQTSGSYFTILQTVL